MCVGSKVKRWEMGKVKWCSITYGVRHGYHFDEKGEITLLFLGKASPLCDKLLNTVIIESNTTLSI